MFRALALVLTFSTPAHAQRGRAITPMTATIEDFCSDPIATICGDRGIAEKAREEKIEELKTKFVVAAWKRVTREVKNPGTLEEWKEALDEQKSDKTAKLTKKQRQIARIYFPALIDEAPNLLGKSFEASMIAFERARKSILSMITKRLANVDGAEKDRMLAQLRPDKVEFANILELMKMSRDNDEALEGFAENCGRDGMADNAYADPSETPEGKNLVVLCAGSFLADFVPGRFNTTSESTYFPQVWTLGHETGHLVDSGSHPVAFSKLASCVEENYKDELKGASSAYMQEISADYWGTEVLAEFISHIEDNQYRLVVLQENLDGLCGAADDGRAEDGGGGHPSGEFRIRNFVRRNPRLHQVLGCKARAPEEAGVSCTLRGAWKKRFW